MDLLGKLDTGTYIETNRQTVADFVADWLPAIEPTVREATFYSYRRNITLHVLPYIGSMVLTKVDGGTLNGLYGRLLADGRRDRTGGLSARSAAYVHTIVHRAFKDAVRWGRLVRNPCDAADPPRSGLGSSPEAKAWDRDTLRRFLDRSKETDDRYYPAWVTLATTGARRGEVLGLRWSDLDPIGGRASIRQTVVAIGHKVSPGHAESGEGTTVDLARSRNDGSAEGMAEASARRADDAR